MIEVTEPSPASEPASAPATTQASRPASQTTSPSPFQPLTDAKVGEWVLYDALNSQQLRYEIHEVGMTRVKTQVSVSLNGRSLGMPAFREDLRDADPLSWETPTGGSRQTSRAAIHTAGRDWNAMLYEDHWTDEGVKYVRRTWVSPEVPVFGFVRMELTGDGTVEARLELSAVGQAK